VIGNADENIRILQQGERLLCSLDDEAYRCDVDIAEVRSIGAHMRHILDHYSSFFSGIEEGLVDYDARLRQKESETDRQVALQSIQAICRNLANLKEFYFNRLRISSYSNQSTLHVGSSLNRELDFLLSHTVHHFAIIAVLCRLQDAGVERDFGVAPSTLRYQAASEQLSVIRANY
jgi:uncharacterized damage-inducible protein DinB